MLALVLIVVVGYYFYNMDEAYDRCGVEGRLDTIEHFSVDGMLKIDGSNYNELLDDFEGVVGQEQQQMALQQQVAAAVAEPEVAKALHAAAGGVTTAASQFATGAGEGLEFAAGKGTLWGKYHTTAAKAQNNDRQQSVCIQQMKKGDPFPLPIECVCHDNIASEHWFEGGQGHIPAPSCPVFGSVTAMDRTINSNRYDGAPNVANVELMKHQCISDEDSCHYVTLDDGRRVAKLGPERIDLLTPEQRKPSIRCPAYRRNHPATNVNEGVHEWCTDGAETFPNEGDYYKYKREWYRRAWEQHKLAKARMDKETIEKAKAAGYTGKYAVDHYEVHAGIEEAGEVVGSGDGGNTGDDNAIDRATGHTSPFAHAAWHYVVPYVEPAELFAKDA